MIPNDTNNINGDFSTTTNSPDIPSNSIFSSPPINQTTHNLKPTIQNFVQNSKLGYKLTRSRTSPWPLPVQFSQSSSSAPFKTNPIQGSNVSNQSSNLKTTSHRRCRYSSLTKSKLKTPSWRPQTFKCNFYYKYTLHLLQVYKKTSWYWLRQP